MSDKITDEDKRVAQEYVKTQSRKKTAMSLYGNKKEGKKKVNKVLAKPVVQSYLTDNLRTDVDLQDKVLQTMEEALDATKTQRINCPHCKKKIMAENMPDWNSRVRMAECIARLNMTMDIKGKKHTSENDNKKHIKDLSDKLDNYLDKNKKKN